MATSYGLWSMGMLVVSTVYYLLAAGVMAVVVYLLSGPLANESLGTVLYGLRLLALVTVGSAVYFGAVYALDSRFREMVRSVLRRT